MTQFEKDIESPHRGLFELAREHLLTLEGIVETQKPRITTYANSDGGICHLRTMPHGIDIGFLKGARMVDEKARLGGAGKSIRVLSLNKFEPETVAYFVAQAVALNRN